MGRKHARNRRSNSTARRRRLTAGWRRIRGPRPLLSHPHTARKNRKRGRQPSEHKNRKGLALKTTANKVHQPETITRKQEETKTSADMYPLRVSRMSSFVQKFAECLYICVFMCAYMSLPVCTCLCVCVYVCMCMYACARLGVWVRACVRVSAWHRVQ